jgi:RimJ/RimL family protein N-acetyltransferase
MLTLQTPDLELIAADAALAQAAVGDALGLLGMAGGFATRLSAIVSPAWPPEILADVQEHFAAELKANPKDAGWWVWYILRKAQQAGSQKELIGAAGFAGPPDEHHQVQIGYAIVSPHQNCGYATQAARALTQWALSQPQVNRVTAQTYPDIKASVRVLEKIGMTHAGPGQEPGTLMFMLEK